MPRQINSKVYNLVVSNQNSGKGVLIYFQTKPQESLRGHKLVHLFTPLAEKACPHVQAYYGNCIPSAWHGVFVRDTERKGLEK